MGEASNSSPEQNPELTGEALSSLSPMEHLGEELDLDSPMEDLGETLMSS